MDHKILLQLLQNKTEEIQSLLDHFKNNPDDLNKGLNLLSDRIDSLSKEFHLMKDGFADIKPTHKEEKQTEPVVIEKTTPEEVISKEEKKEESEPSNEPVVVKSEPIVETVEEADLVKVDHEAILNDQLQKKSTEVIGEKLINNKLSDIQTAIGINDRFLFIRELFDNNSDAYNSTINFINNTDNFNAIEAHLKANNNWDFEDPTVMQFIELTKRKF